MWEVDWETVEIVPKYGRTFRARNTMSTDPRSANWHMVTFSELKRHGVTIPKELDYQWGSPWEVDWERVRKSSTGYSFMARCPLSPKQGTRRWHFITVTDLIRARVDVPDRFLPGDPREQIGDKYVRVHGDYLSPEEQELADHFGLWVAGRVEEHRLVAAKKYGDDYDPRTMVVRHKNGVKDDNRPENILIGTYLENTMDHDTARKAAMYWHQECRVLERESAALDSEITELRARLARYETDIAAD